jgi:hypothetical protein
MQQQFEYYQNRIKTLSNEIQHKILSYTYSIQPKELLYDIKHYYASKIAIETIYYEIWIDDWGERPPHDKNWLFNDILGYTNEKYAFTTKIVDNFYNMFFRYPLLKTKRSIHIFVKRLFSQRVTKQIKIFWGLLKPHERNDFMHYIKRIYWDQHVRINRNLQNPLFA